jgi:hypothetical protein
VPLGAGGETVQSSSSTGTILGVVFGLGFLIAIGVVIWLFVSRRRKSTAEDVMEYETDVESVGETDFSTETSDYFVSEAHPDFTEIGMEREGAEFDFLEAGIEETQFGF